MLSLISSKNINKSKILLAMDLDGFSQGKKVLIHIIIKQVKKKYSRL
jgi:hypothetical protein